MEINSFVLTEELIRSLNSCFYHSDTYEKIFEKRRIIFEEKQLNTFVRWLFMGGSTIGKIHLPAKVLKVLGNFRSQGLATADVFLTCNELKYAFLKIHSDDKQTLWGDPHAYHEKLDNKVRILLQNYVHQPSLQDTIQYKLLQSMDMINEYVCISKSDLEGNITAVSDAFLELSEYGINELIGKNHRIFKHPDTDEAVYKNMWETITSAQTWEGEMRNLSKNGKTFWTQTTIMPELDFDGKITGYVAIRKDITDKKIVEELAIKDELTGLYNRRYYREFMQKELQRLKRQNGNLVFMMLDVDHFKLYNDTYGHQKGDTILKQVADVLKYTVKRGGDFVFRMGGEEFAILLPDTKQQDGYHIAQKIRQKIEALKIEHKASQNASHLTISIGLAFREAGSDTAIDEATLYKIADDALYQAKNAGRNRIVSQPAAPV